MMAGSSLKSFARGVVADTGASFSGIGAVASVGAATGFGSSTTSEGAAAVSAIGVSVLILLLFAEKLYQSEL
jgi:hypothetical protein